MTSHRIDQGLDVRGPITATEPIKPGTYTVATLPDATEHTGALVWVSDASGGAKPAISDGTDWKIVTLGATIS